MTHELVVKVKVKVKCIYMGTHQLFPAPVLARRRLPDTVVRVRLGLSLHLSHHVNTFVRHANCLVLGDTFLGGLV